MIDGAAHAIERGDRSRIPVTRRLDDVLDRLNAAIKAYVARLDPETLSDADEERVCFRFFASERSCHALEGALFRTVDQARREVSADISRRGGASGL